MQLLKKRSAALKAKKKIKQYFYRRGALKFNMGGLTPISSRDTIRMKKFNELKNYVQIENGRPFGQMTY